MRKGVGLQQPERLSGLGGGGARATQPGAGRPASPWVATTDPTLRAKAVAARPGQVRQGRVALERSPPPRCQRPRSHFAPGAPGCPWRRTGRGCDLHPQNLPCWARCRLVLPGRVGFAISIPPPGLGPPPAREPGETHGRGRIVGGPRAPNRLLRHVCASAFQNQRRLGQSGPVPIEAEDESWKRGMRACRWGLRLLGDTPPPKTPSPGNGPVTRAFEAT